MQANASGLEDERRQRVEEASKRDAEEREEALGKNFDRSKFVSKMNSQAIGLGMHENMRRSGALVASEE